MLRAAKAGKAALPKKWSIAVRTVTKPGNVVTTPVITAINRITR